MTRKKKEGKRGGACVRQKSRVIYDTQTEGATAINMCLGTLQTDTSRLLMGSKFVGCGCGDQSSQTWKDCFHVSAPVRAYIANSCDTDGGAL